MACVGDTVLTEYNGSQDDSDNNGTGSGSFSQSFTIPNDASVCGMSFFGGKGTVGTQPGTLMVEILDGISGTVLATTGILASSLFPDFTSPVWNKVEFAVPVNLTAGVTYFVKITSLTGSTNDVFRWFSDTTSPSYANGTEWRGTTQFTGRDKLFRIHGVEGGGGGVIPKCNNLLMMGV